MVFAIYETSKYLVELWKNWEGGGCSFLIWTVPSTMNFSAYASNMEKHLGCFSGVFQLLQLRCAIILPVSELTKYQRQRWGSWDPCHAVQVVQSVCLYWAVR